MNYCIMDRKGDLMNILSLFDGMSAGRLALERSNFKIDKYYASEIAPAKIKASQDYFPDNIYIGDVTKWENWEIKGKIDLLLSGFPCQPYSVMGNRKGLDDKRGGDLVDSMFAILKKYKPETCLFENVPGLLNIDNGNTFKTILKEINNCGYAVDWFVINSSLLSAQNRKRVYIVGKLLNYCNNYKVLINVDNKRSCQFSLF